MKNKENWRPTKFIVNQGCLGISKDPNELRVSSRLSAHVVTEAYNRHFHQHCKGKLLDLGCGKVPFYEFYKDHIDDNVCVDWELSVHGTNHVDVACDLSQRIALDDAQFDTILLSSVLEHLPEPMLLWEEMSRLLKPDGKVILNVPFLYGLHEVPHDFFRYTEFALRRMAEANGFEIVVLEPLGGAPVVVCDIMAKILAGRRWIGSPLARCIQGSCRLALWFSLGKKLAARSIKQFPITYFVVAKKL